MDEPLIIGERLFVLRNQHQMTQEELAEELNVSRQSISKWELNKALPDLERIIRISRLYDVSLNYILFGTEDEALGQEVILEQESSVRQQEKTEEESKKDVEIQKMHSKESGRAGRRNLLVCIIIVGILVAVSCFTTAYFLWNNAWNKRHMEERLVQVTKVYEQYTKADVLELHDDYEQKRTVWLDIDGVRENDFVYCYAGNAENELRIDYYPRTWICSAGISLIFIVLFILLYMELKKQR